MEETKGNTEPLDENQKIIILVATLASGEIPKTYTVFGNLVWQIFNLGRSFEIELRKGTS
jgi:hypothetical protein